MNGDMWLIDRTAREWREEAQVFLYSLNFLLRVFALLLALGQSQEEWREREGRWDNNVRMRIVCDSFRNVHNYSRRRSHWLSSSCVLISFSLLLVPRLHLFLLLFLSFLRLSSSHSYCTFFCLSSHLIVTTSLPALSSPSTPPPIRICPSPINRKRPPFITSFHHFFPILCHSFLLCLIAHYPTKVPSPHTIHVSRLTTFLSLSIDSAAFFYLLVITRTLTLYI
jgi:hypothetical protein